MTEGEKVWTAIAVLILLVLTGLAIWSTGEAERNRQKDLEIIRICAKAEQAAICSEER